MQNEAIFDCESNISGPQGIVKITLEIKLNDKLRLLVKHGYLGQHCSLTMDQARELKKMIERQLFALKLPMD